MSTMEITYSGVLEMVIPVPTPPTKRPNRIVEMEVDTVIVPQEQMKAGNAQYSRAPLIPR